MIFTPNDGSVEDLSGRDIAIERVLLLGIQRGRRPHVLPRSPGAPRPLDGTWCPLEGWSPMWLGVCRKVRREDKRGRRRFDSLILEVRKTPSHPTAPANFVLFR